MVMPDTVPNWINGCQFPAESGAVFEKRSPHNSEILCTAARSASSDVSKAVDAAVTARDAWAEMPAVQRGMILHGIVRGMQDAQGEIARIVAAETGKSMKDALGETGGAVQLGLFYASEAQRLYGRTTTSNVPGRFSMTVRQPIGTAGLIVPANTPIANVAWKVFPALACGNTAVLKAAEDTPATAWIFGRIAHEAGLPEGVLNIIQGFGLEAGEPLVAHPEIGVVSFTGSTAVGKRIQAVAGARLARVSLELGGKNPLIVCDDAELDRAVKWVLLSAFSNAGQRCAAAGRIIIFEAIYERFREMLARAVGSLKIGVEDTDDFGPVINERQLGNMIQAIDQAREAGAVIITGGERIRDERHRAGYYLAPTLIEKIDPHHRISTTELFGPVTCLYRAKDFDDALRLANDSPYGLTACIHTQSLERSMRFIREIQAGVAIVNAGTYGSEPHMPFGGVKQSGNGTREPGTEALDVYSYLKDVYIHGRP